MMPSRAGFSLRQRGASLVVALIFLVIMAMLGVTLANVTNLEERMTGNTRDRDLALQAAEAALRDAEVRLADPGFRDDGFPEVDPEDGNDAAYWETCFTTDAAPCNATYTPVTGLPTAGGGAISAQPEFIVQTKPTAGTTQIYRVTARAVGGSPDTVVVLQAEFGYTPPP
jgi:type IV pilus assembly protein PilX